MPFELSTGRVSDDHFIVRNMMEAIESLWEVDRQGLARCFNMMQVCLGLTVVS